MLARLCTSLAAATYDLKTLPVTILLFAADLIAVLRTAEFIRGITNPQEKGRDIVSVISCCVRVILWIVRIFNRCLIFQQPAGLGFRLADVD